MRERAYSARGEGTVMEQLQRMLKNLMSRSDSDAAGLECTNTAAGPLPDLKRKEIASCSILSQPVFLSVPASSPPPTK